MKKVLIPGAVVSALLVAGSAVAAPIVFNGDFEMHKAASPYEDATDATIGTVIPGWGLIGGGLGHNVALLSAGYLGQTTQEVDVSGDTDAAPGGIYQTIGTVALQDYQLTFQVYTGGGTNIYSGGVNVDVNDGSGQNGLTLVSQQDLQGNDALGDAGLRTYTYDFTAASANTTLNFTMFSQPVSQIDNVSVQAVPEPFTMVLGVSAVGLFLKRRSLIKRS